MRLLSALCVLLLLLLVWGQPADPPVHQVGEEPEEPPPKPPPKPPIEPKGPDPAEPKLARGSAHAAEADVRGGPVRELAAARVGSRRAERQRPGAAAGQTAHAPGAARRTSAGRQRRRF